MGTKEIRTAVKVDLNRPAKDQPDLHVCSPLFYTECTNLSRTVGMQIVGYPF